MGKEKAYFTYFYIPLFTIEGSQGRDMEAGAVDAEAVEGC